MSYIIKSTSPFISVKLTEIGRQKLALGRLNFNSWAIGDSEINYDREEIVDSNQTSPVLSASSAVLRPVDRQPDLKYFIYTGGTGYLNPINQSNFSVVKAVVNNEAVERGFFSGSPFNFTTLTGSTYILSTTTLNNTNFSGGTQFSLGTGVTANVGDIILIKYTNDLTTGFTVNNNSLPLPNLWYKVQELSGGTVTVDRDLPNLTNQTGSTSQVIVYRGGEVYDTIGSGTTTAYWDTGTLSFDSQNNISCSDVPVWNQNNVWCENLAGITGLTGNTAVYEDYTRFGSYRYLGTKYPYLEYECIGTGITDTLCNLPGSSYLDNVSKSIAIIHYTNNSISNVYGEFFYFDFVNSKTLKIHLPDIMYHRRNFSTASGTTMGMTFVTTGSTKFIGTSEIEYYDLIEEPTLVNGTPLTVGKVFPQYKIVVIENDEIVAATSYKSNRNWTLPELSATLSSPSGGTASGILQPNETIYLSYILENSTGTGLTTSLPCQTYVKLSNTTSSSKDVNFKITDIDLLPYMRKIEDVNYDGLGFYAYNFKLVYQIVNDPLERPSPGNWKVYDYTSTAITTNVNETIDPLLLENQISTANGFTLNSTVSTASTTFDLISILSMAPISNPDLLQFGDERFFYGNLETYIGATIFKSIFDLRINSSNFRNTTNPTRSTNILTNPPDLKISEVGIYDGENDLVLIGKISNPVRLESTSTIMIELSIDF